MAFDQWYYVIAIILVIIGAGVLIFVYAKSRIAKDTIALSKDTISIMESHKTAQDRAIKDLQDDSVEKEKRISHLSGQVDVLKDLPLRKIGDSLETLGKTQETITHYLNDHNDVTNQGVEKIIKHIDAVMAVKK